MGQGFCCLLLCDDAYNFNYIIFRSFMIIVLLREPQFIINHERAVEIKDLLLVDKPKLTEIEEEFGVTIKMKEDYLYVS